jgi:hypothetical protein
MAWFADIPRQCSHKPCSLPGKVDSLGLAILVCIVWLALPTRAITLVVNNQAHVE